VPYWWQHEGMNFKPRIFVSVLRDLFLRFLAHPVAPIAKGRQFLIASALRFRGDFLPVLHYLSSAMHLFSSFVSNIVTLWQLATKCGELRLFM